MIVPAIKLINQNFPLNAKWSPRKWRNKPQEFNEHSNHRSTLAKIYSVFYNVNAFWYLKPSGQGLNVEKEKVEVEVEVEVEMEGYD
ncbi:hypothetical protein HZH66_001010 [Vespula vulgaris]|uniref:Uncharacterized protein n=1 Tax=Vespula vulgaris TaxID=7454 RepID=A0A834NLB9_VESVU|nr:hypothetical protein HZH66_001010 [Vespula vulgaris]